MVVPTAVGKWKNSSQRISRLRFEVILKQWPALKTSVSSSTDDVKLKFSFQLVSIPLSKEIINHAEPCFLLLHSSSIIVDLFIPAPAVWSVEIFTARSVHISSSLSLESASSAVAMKHAEL